MSDKSKTFASGLLFGVAMATLVSIISINVARGAFGGGDKSSPLTSDGSALIDEEFESKTNTILSSIMTGLYEDLEAENLRDGMFKGLMDSLGDKYAAYYTADEYYRVKQSTYSYIYGIGVVLSELSDRSGFVILKVYEDTPAEREGLIAGDVIKSADGLITSGITLSELVSRVRGEEGTYVNLTVYRESEDLTFDVDVPREKINVPTVYADMADTDKNIGYIQISEFGGNTAEEFNESLDRLLSEGIEGLVIDLRNNPGGIVSAVEAVADRLLPEGVIVYTEDRFGTTETATSDANYLDLPMAVLVNGSSASSAEILAGALQDHEQATLIGEVTYGKGVVQVVKGLSDGSAIKYTGSRYLTPNKRNIDGVGIKPDIELEYEYTGSDESPFEYKYDNQINKAIEVLTEN